MINYNELRRLAAAIGKSKPVLGHLYIASGTAYFTDGAYLVVIREHSPNMPAGTEILIDLNTLVINTKGLVYPSVGNITDKLYGLWEPTTEVFKGEVIYSHIPEVGPSSEPMKRYIDPAIIAQLKKLIAVKGWAFDPTKVVIGAKGGIGRILLGDNIDIYFILKATPVEKPKNDDDDSMLD